MLLLPIAQERPEVRRFPWVSIVLIALNFLVACALFIPYDEDAVQQEIAQGWERIERYVGNHPYLRLPPEAAERLPGATLEGLLGLQESAQGKKPDPLTVVHEQAELDALGARLEESFQKMPSVRWGFVPARPSFARLFVSMFVHLGWLHLAGNMLFFYLSGPFVEDRFGRTLFGALFVLSGIVGTVAQTLSAPSSPAPLVGASGAIAGVMGAFLVRLGASRIRFIALPIPIIPAIRFTIVLPGFVLMPLWIGQQLVYAREVQAESGVALWSLVGGSLFGLAAAAAIRLLRVEERWVQPAVEEQIALVPHPSLERTTQARLRGDLEAARAEVRAVLSEDAQNVQALLEAYEIARAAGEPEEIGATAARLMQAYAQVGETRLAFEIVAEAVAPESPPLPFAFYLAAGHFLEKERDGRGAMDLYARIVARQPDDPAAFEAWYRTGEILRRAGDPKRAREAYERARAHPSCAGPWPATVDRALAELARHANPRPEAQVLVTEPSPRALNEGEEDQ